MTEGLWILATPYSQANVVCGAHRLILAVAERLKSPKGIMKYKEVVESISLIKYKHHVVFVTKCFSEFGTIRIFLNAY